MATLQSINARIEKLRTQAEALAQKDRAGAVSKVLKLMAQLGVTVSDLPSGGAAAKGRRRGAAGQKAVGVARYRDPASGKTWTGHGRAPDWIKNARNRDEFLIDGASAQAEEPAAARKSRGRKAAAKGAAGAGRAGRAAGKSRAAAEKPAAKKSKPRKSAAGKRAGRASNAAAKPSDESTEAQG